MMDTNWLAFFGIIAGSGASFGGLIFVAMGNNKAWAEHPLREIVALRTLSEFLLPCFFGIEVFIPPNDWHLPALAMAAAWLYLLVIYWRAVRNSPDLANQAFDREQLLSIPFSIIVFAVLVGVTLLDLAGITLPPMRSNLTWIALTMVVLFVTGWLEVWVFYVNPPPPLET
jgi:hypothetical protein